MAKLCGPRRFKKYTPMHKMLKIYKNVHSDQRVVDAFILFLNTLWLFKKS